MPSPGSATRAGGLTDVSSVSMSPPPLTGTGPLSTAPVDGARSCVHNTKTHAGWQLQQPEPGRYMWTAPTGHTFTIDPEIIGPILVGPEPEPRGEPPPELDTPPF
jgi:hypothetical protein